VREKSNSFPGKKVPMWYLGKEDKVTIWFKSEEDRDYWLNGGSISTSPGRDKYNTFFSERTTANVVPKDTTDGYTKDKILKDLVDMRESLDSIISNINNEL